jgi:oxalate decarboxylase/phosphoglucose isomerase-like protein (cupin superfamily)
MRRAFVLGVLAGGLVIGAVVASATPPSGARAAIVARGTVAEPIVVGTPKVVTVTKRVKVRVGGRTVTKRVTFKVKSVEPLISCSASSPCDTAVQQVTLDPGGSTGWHTHPGPTVVAVAEGEGTLYHADQQGCPGHKFATGTGFFQPTHDVHVVRNEGPAPLVVYASYILPRGTPSTAILTDQPQPASCPNVP